MARILARVESPLRLGAPSFGARLAARLYDPLLEPLVGGFRDTGLSLAPGEPGLRVLDVGCGTGTHLARYAARGAAVTGLDPGPAMLARARRRLGPDARLILGSGESLPFRDGAFDLAVTMTVLHTLSAGAARRMLAEMARVVRPEGRDPGRPTGLRGRAIHLFTGAIERVAGADHFRSYRRFLAEGGVPALAGRAGLVIEHWSIEAGGTMGVYVLRSRVG
jgi:SAM-dependent methyltransferase